MINWLEEANKNREEIIKTLVEWVKINSVYDETTITEEHPFGKGVNDALEFIIETAKKDGFETVNDDGYALHIDHGHGEEIVGILGHYDVVPEGEGWSYPPFSGAIVDNKIYGRGTQDDKGPVIASYFATKIIKDMGLDLSKKIRIILGGNEERDWKCVDHYFKKYPRPNIGFTPDGDFPLVYGEKEIRIMQFNGVYQCEQILELTGGSAANSVAEYAKAVVAKKDSNIIQAFETFLENNKITGKSSIFGDNIEFIVNGISAHGSTPEKGVNAIVYLLKFLAENTDNKMIKYFANSFAKYDGSGLDIAYTDNKMGSLTLNVGIVNYVAGQYSFTLDIRHPLDVDTEELVNKLNSNGTNNAWPSDVKELGKKKGLYLDLESPLIKTLTKAYVDHTNDTTTKPYVIGGGTYARATDNIVCFGMLFPKSKNAMHQLDEAVDIDELILATAIYAQAIYDLAK